eukprot:1362889-Ditylum_brightwellii.AAC.1
MAGREPGDNVGAVKERKDGELVLIQEGCRYGVEEYDGGEQELIYKRVVYSEMKGVYSNPDSLLDHFSQHLLYPNNTYQHDSGGDPEFIPSLMHAQVSAYCLSLPSKSVPSSNTRGEEIESDGEEEEKQPDEAV